MTATASDIDAVITWVDGSDPAHRAKLHDYLQASGLAAHGSAAPTRFGDCKEIEFCVASLLRYAPWIRRIHIVADAQSPDFIESLRGTAYEDRVRVVDHREFFQGFEDQLPTFSNRSIECLMWRMPDLAERFIYFNDDFQLLRAVQPADFFHEGGVVLRGQWRRQSALKRGARGLLARIRKALGRADPRPGNHAAQALSARLAGFHDRYLQAPHVPHPMRKSVVAEFFAQHPALLTQNLRHRLRHEQQFVTTALAAHLELAAGTAKIDNRLGGLRLKADVGDAITVAGELARADSDEALAFGCVQSLDLAAPAVRQQVLAWLLARIALPWASRISAKSREA
jgi:hypothetical protein